jgi:RNA polymerase sigma factor (sigma-70 family)
VEGAREEPESVDVEGLLREGTWVSRLARRLVLDTSTADDVVQETWIAALRHGPFEPGRLRPWLARVVRNFARHEKRSRRHRGEREESSARPECEPSALETAERIETQRRLVEALASIAEPYRTTLMRRYYDGLSAAEIADIDGIPAATVRWRLMRGVEELRTKLDARYGDRHAWGLALLALTTPRGAAHVAAAGSGTLVGVFVMNALARTALVAALVVTASLGVFLVTRDAQPIAPGSALAPAALGDAEKALVPPRATTEIAAAEALEARTVAPVANEAKPAVLKPADQGTHARVDGRFLDVDGHPIAGVTITAPLALEGQAVTSDAAGRFDFETDTQSAGGNTTVADPRRELDANFFAERAGFASLFVRQKLVPNATTHTGDIVLEFGGSVAGVVVDGDGHPLAGARVVVIRPDLSDDVDNLRRSGPHVFPGAPETKSGADGTFEIAGVPARLMRAWAGQPGMRWAMSVPVDVPLHGVMRGVELKLEPLAAEDRVEGFVLAPDGTPIPEISVTYRYTTLSMSGSSAIQADAKGHFRILVPAKVPLDLSVSDPRQRWPAVSMKDVAPGTLDCRLSFQEARHIALAFVDEHGAPIARAAFSANSTNGQRFLASEDEHDLVDGQTPLVLPAEPFMLEAWASGRARVELGPFDPARVGARLEITLESLPGLRGVVLAGDSPVSGARLSLYAFPESGTRIEHNGFLTRIDQNTLEEATSDAKGRFELTVRKPGSYVVVCESAGHALAEITLRDVDPKQGRGDLVIHVGAGGAIEGRVLVAKGREASGVVVGINRFDGRARTQRVGADGKFRFEGLTPGDWEVKRALTAIDSNNFSTVWMSGVPDVKYETNCAVAEGQTTHFDLDLGAELDARLLGHVTMNGAPAAGWSVSARPGDVNVFTSPLPGGAIDTRGDVTIPLPHPATYFLEIRQVVEDGTALKISEELEVHANDNVWTLDLSCGAIEGRVTAGDATRVVTIAWTNVQGTSASSQVNVDADGHFKIPCVPAGAVELRLRNANHEDASALGKRAVEVKRGETAHVDWQ